MKPKFAVPLVSKLMHNWFRNTIRHPKYGGWIIAASLAYLLSPFDISPDVLPIVGWVDDGLLATLVVAEVSQLLLDRFKNQKQSEISTVQPTV
ncbi:MAG: DUF1232 domain-containing protein [Timaviella obliquedivisa GSE-PSE-MK23-08B]|nr:DUF1232 domain-containing protein [Timaviella obliquedivisa GSE-PSE-MK23-08B]